jgi:exonuclease III
MRELPKPNNNRVNDKLIIIHQNIRGIMNKVDEFLISVNDIAPQIICLTEHHAMSDEIEYINFNQYKLSTFFCRRYFKQGGVCILVKSNIQTDTIKFHQFNKEKDFESCCLKFQFLTKSYIVVCMYRSPTGNFSYFLEQLELLLNRICKLSCVIILCGDFNINYLHDNPRKDELDSLLASFNLKSVINFPTRISSNSCTLIDNIFINNYLHAFSVYPLINGLSDHDAQALVLNIDSPLEHRHKFYYKRIINNDTMKQFLISLSFENWEEVFSASNVNEAFNSFLNTYLRVFYSSFPLKKTKILHTQKPWITCGIKVSCANKRTLYLASRSSNDPRVKKHYKKYCKILTTTIKAAKRQYYNSLINKSTNKIKTTWNIVKNIANNTRYTAAITKMKINDKLELSLTKITEAFNNYFSTVAGRVINDNYSRYPLVNKKEFLVYLEQNFQQPYPKMKLCNTNAYEIQKIILAMKPKHSFGYDEISIRIMKTSTPCIVSPLTYICNKVLQTGIFPDRLKYAEVKPLYKKGDKKELCNYRPISLLPNFSKVIEKVIYKRLSQHLHINNILVDEQFGFRKGSSTEMATFQFLNKVLTSLDEKSYVGSLLCDLQKAFDCVNHDILLEKLKFYGISGAGMKLMSSYLEDRYQRVVIEDIKFNKVVSKWERVEHGVPQGSILGPLLFLIYINDFPFSVNNLAQPILFADDTSMVISNPCPEEFEKNIKLVLNAAIIWFNRNLLTLNHDKTHFLQFFLKKNRELEIQISTDKPLITNLNCSSFLGITIDNVLSWKNHILKISLKLNKACFAVRAIRPFISLDSIKMVYYSYVHSILEYGIIFWGSAPLSVNIFKIQKRIIRVMAGLSKSASCRESFKKLHILTFQSQFILSLSLFVVKNKNYFTINREIHDINTRYCNNFYLPTTNLSKVQKGVLFSGSRIFNHLPSNIKSASADINRFKCLLKRYLIDRAFYTMNEFYENTSQ